MHAHVHAHVHVQDGADSRSLYSLLTLALTVGCSRARQRELEEPLAQPRQVNRIEGRHRVDEQWLDVLLADEKVEGTQQQQPAHLVRVRARARVRVRVWGGLGLGLREAQQQQLAHLYCRR